MRRLLQSAATLLGALLLLPAPAGAGSVAGKIELIEKGGRPASDLSDVVVWVDGAKARPRPDKAVVKMRGKKFEPRVVAVGVGTTIEFPNEDPIFHNVFSVSGENRFDLQLYKRPKSASWTFEHPGVVRVYCNIHPQMNAIVVVRDNPYFTRAARDGSFSLDGVPAGKHVLKAWHERGGEAEIELVVPASGSVGASLTLDASSYRRLPHKRKDGSDYDRREKY